MSRQLLIQIVPRFLPQFDGIGDHAYVLAGSLREHQEIDSAFIDCDPRSEGPDSIDGYRVHRLAKRTAEGLLEAVRELSASSQQQPFILLQFCLYGYEQRGCPLWLLSALKQLTADSSTRLGVMFHELDAGMQSPWKSAFWLYPIHRLIIAAMGRVADHVFTNTAIYRDKLKANGLNREIPLIPSFSTIGEPSSFPAWNQREKQLVVFGRPSQRAKVFTDGARALIELCQEAGIERVVDVGSDHGLNLAELLPGISVLKLGRCPAEQVSQLLSTSMGSILHYPTILLGKSSIYGASCAHGAVPFLLAEKLANEESSCLTWQFLDLSEPLGSEVANLPRISSEVYDEYQNRSSIVAARIIASALLERC
jgi:hypothetical protein